MRVLRGYGAAALEQNAPLFQVSTEDGRVSFAVATPAYTSPPEKVFVMPTWAKALIIGTAAATAGYIGYRATRR